MRSLRDGGGLRFCGYADATVFRLSEIIESTQFLDGVMRFACDSVRRLQPETGVSESDYQGGLGV